MAVSDAHVFPGFLTQELTQLFFPKPPTTFLTCFCRGERRKHAGKKSSFNLGSNSQLPGHESYMLTTEPPGWALGKGRLGMATCKIWQAYTLWLGRGRFLKFSLYKPMLKLWAPGRGQIWPKGYNMGTLGRGLLDREIWKWNSSGHELFIFRILLTAIDWNF